MQICVIQTDVPPFSLHFCFRSHRSAGRPHASSVGRSYRHNSAEVRDSATSEQCKIQSRASMRGSDPNALR